MKSAQSSIDIAIFILGEDLIWRQILDCLKEKAALGIRVRLMLDGIGSFKLPKKLLQPLLDNGAEVAWFMPVVHRYLCELNNTGGRIWFVPKRMVHAKAFVVDTTFAMAGSVNMDIRSLFLNFEVMSVFNTETDICWLAAWMESLREQSDHYQPVTAGAFQEMVEGVILLAAYQL